MLAILSFLGGSVGRMLFEKIFSLIERKQDHEQELASLRLQGELDAAQHLRNIELTNLQAQLKVQFAEIEQQGAREAMDGEAFIESIRNAKPSGITWIDGASALVRPLTAYLSLGILIGVLVWLGPETLRSMTDVQRAALGATIIEFFLSLAATAIGWFFGSRSLMPSKK